MMVLLGLAVVVVGFAVRLNPLLVVVASALVTGWFAGLGPLEVLAVFGKAFNESRYVTAVYLVLPVIGVLERAGLQDQARRLIARLKGASPGRLLTAYMAFRQITAACGLLSIAGQAQTVRPLVAPMTETAAEVRDPRLTDKTRQGLRALAAATDNIAVFFGEDIFLAMGSILLMVGFLATSGLVIEPFHLSMWAIPSAICAFVVHAARLVLLDRRLRAAAAAAEGEGKA